MKIIKIIAALCILLILMFLLIKKNLGLNPSLESNKQYRKLAYYKNEKFVNLQPTTYNFDKMKQNKFKTFCRFAFKSENAPKQQLPLIKPNFTENISDFALFWLGHSSTILELDGKRLIIDPIFGNASPIPFIVHRYTKAPITKNELPKIDYVIITHNHYDHLERKTIQHLKNSFFIVPLGVGETLQAWGIKKENIIELGWNDDFKNEDLSITAVPSVHFSSRSFNDRDKTLWNSYVIQAKNKKIFWSGDTGYNNLFKEYGEKYGPFDFAALEIDAWNEGWPNTHLFLKEAIQAIKDLKANYFLPIHWGVFDLAKHKWDESINIIMELSDKENIKVLTPKMGEKVDDNNLSFEPWWKIKK